MRINCIFELSLVLDSEKFHKILGRVSDRNGYIEKYEEEYVDRSLAQKGMTVVYRDSQYKKKVRVLAGAASALTDHHDRDQFIRKLDKRIAEYFGFKYRLDDFTLSGLVLTADIDAGNHKNVQAYLKVLQRIGRVKGFSPSEYDCFEKGESFCLDGNSNGIRFRVYDLGSLLGHRLQSLDKDRKKIMAVVMEAQGILRAEVHLAKQKAVRAYTDAADTSGQIAELLGNCQEIFIGVFRHIIPFGNFYKKDKAVEIVRKEVENAVLRRKMLRLLELIPEKKSLYLAQKAMNCRDIEKVMAAFVKINVSPVTIGKRYDVKRLRNLYDYF